MLPNVDLPEGACTLGTSRTGKIGQCREEWLIHVFAYLFLWKRGKKVVSRYGAADWVIADDLFLYFDDSDMTWEMRKALGSCRKRKKTTVELVGGPFAGRVATIQSCDNSLRIFIERDES